MKKILFVCTGNSCRSVMAEALFKKIAARHPHLKTASAGVSALEGFPASPETVQALMAEESIDVSGHRTRRLTPEMIHDADRIFVMEASQRNWVLQMVPEVKDKISLMTDFVSEDDYFKKGMDIPDPIRMSDDFYKNVLGLIRSCVKNAFEHLTAQKEKGNHR